MTSHFFLLSGPVTSERLSWFEEALKFYFIQIYPESLMYRANDKEPGIYLLPHRGCTREP